MKRLVFSLLAACVWLQAPAQGNASAYAADVVSPDALLAALYDVISGPDTKDRDWDRFRYLFLPEGSLGYVVYTPEGNRAVHLTVQQYVDYSAERLKAMGFHEVEINRVAEHYGPLYHAWSTYEGRRGSPTGEVIARGINSILLLEKEGRWWIKSVFWHPESAETPLPEAYLPK